MVLDAKAKDHHPSSLPPKFSTLSHLSIGSVAQGIDLVVSFSKAATET